MNVTEHTLDQTQATDIRSAKDRPANIALLPAFRSAKIQTGHLQKLAIVYVRQSSPQQVLENRESTARQYALAEYAEFLGTERDHE